MSPKQDTTTTTTTTTTTPSLTQAHHEMGPATTTTPSLTQAHHEMGPVMSLKQEAPATTAIPAPTQAHHEMGPATTTAGAPHCGKRSFEEFARGMPVIYGAAMKRQRTSLSTDSQAYEMATQAFIKLHQDKNHGSEAEKLEKERQAINIARQELAEKEARLEEHRNGLEAERISIQEDRASIQHESISIENARRQIENERISIQNAQNDIHNARIFVQQEGDQVNVSRRQVDADRTQVDADRAQVNNDHIATQRVRVKLQQEHVSLKNHHEKQTQELGAEVRRFNNFRKDRARVTLVKKRKLKRWQRKLNTERSWLNVERKEVDIIIQQEQHKLNTEREQLQADTQEEQGKLAAAQATIWQDQHNLNVWRTGIEQWCKNLGDGAATNQQSVSEGEAVVQVDAAATEQHSISEYDAELERLRARLVQAKEERNALKRTGSNPGVSGSGAMGPPKEENNVLSASASHSGVGKSRANDRANGTPSKSLVKGLEMVVAEMNDPRPSTSGVLSQVRVIDDPVFVTPTPATPSPAAATSDASDQVTPASELRRSAITGADNARKLVGFERRNPPTSEQTFEHLGRLMAATEVRETDPMDAEDGQPPVPEDSEPPSQGEDFLAFDD